MVQAGSGVRRLVSWGNEKDQKARLELGQKVNRLDPEIGSLVVVAGDIL